MGNYRLRAFGELDINTYLNTIDVEYFKPVTCLRFLESLNLLQLDHVHRDTLYRCQR